MNTVTISQETFTLKRSTDECETVKIIKEAIRRYNIYFGIGNNFILDKLMIFKLFFKKEKDPGCGSFYKRKS